MFPYLGYTALHYAAAWGKVQCLKILVELGSNLQVKTSHGERAREIALRYNQSECVDYLDWAGLYMLMFNLNLFELALNETSLIKV